MDSNLKKEIKEIIALVQECPENLQEKAFEILLKDFLEENIKDQKDEKAKKKNESKDGNTKQDGKEGFANFNLPMRVKGFLKKYKIEPNQLDNFFMVEGDAIERIWNLKAEKLSHGQIHVALFLALENALKSKEFIFDWDVCRDKCKEKKTHDKNFKANFRNNEVLFSRFSEEEPVSLSDDGMAKLAKLIKDED